ncbi:MAG: protein translocase subunit SecF [Candidatus Wildermuthbacteria bacterium]|nr:protein translocase subunit SecF [Candidatus Wildermuthbacteria bacterium]
MNFIRYSTIYFLISFILIIASVAALFVFGVRLGPEFTGGSILEVQYQGAAPSPEELRTLLSPLGLESLQIQGTGENRVIFRTREIPESSRQQILTSLGDPPAGKAGNATELRFESIGPVIGKELRQKTFIIAGLALLVIVAYVAFAFRRTMGVLAPWHWGVASLLSLFHDVFLPLGLLAFVGSLGEFELNIPVVVALLTVIGYSINNNIVVFDRVRENLLRRTGFDLQDTVNKSLAQTFVRNMNTSLTTLIPLAAIFFFGGDTLRGFSLVLMAGIAVGFYSALFFSPSFLVKVFGKAPSPEKD